jgi:hypothetical protein
MANTSKFSFVILLEYVPITISDLYTYGLKIIENESDLELGYFTVEGENQSIKEFKSFLNGTNFI